MHRVPHSISNENFTPLLLAMWTCFSEVSIFTQHFRSVTLQPVSLLTHLEAVRAHLIGHECWTFMTLAALLAADHPAVSPGTARQKSSVACGCGCSAARHRLQLSSEDDTSHGTWLKGCCSPEQPSYFAWAMATLEPASVSARSLDRCPLP